MNKYYVTFKQYGEQEHTPCSSKQKAIFTYLSYLTSNFDISELKICKQLNNGKTIDMTTSINNFLKG